MRNSPGPFAHGTWPALVLFILLAAGSPAQAQRPEADLLSDLRASFRALEYARVERLARSAIEHFDQYSPPGLAEVHRVLGLTYFYQGLTDQAREQFEAALSLDAAAELDPLMVPPQAVSFYEELRRQAATGNASDASARYLFLYDPRPGAAVRSFLVPGWGQLYKDHDTKGVVLLGAWGLTAGGGVIAHLARRQAHDSYESGIEPADIAARYDRFNRLHKLRNSLVLGAAAVWIYAAFDALLTDAPGASVAIPSAGAEDASWAPLLRIRF